jgi:hypothetical protein
MKKVIEYMQKQEKTTEQVDSFKKKIQAWVVSLLSKERFKNLAFFIGTSIHFEFKKLIQARIWQMEKEKVK